MEFPTRLIRAQRWLAAACLAAAVGVAWLEARSPLAAAIREGRPWPFWLEVRTGGTPALFLGVAEPARRALELVYVPQASSPEQAAERLAAALGDRPALPVLVEEAASWPAEEPPVAVKMWLARRARDLAGRAGEGSTVDRFDRLLLALEAAKAGSSGLHPAWLPEPESRAAFLARLLEGRETEAPPTAITVEVLNATAQKGVASRATKVLRSKGADVVNVGNLTAPLRRTVAYDRTGRIENAALVREMLGCRAAQAVTQISAKSLVDVTLILAEDCPPDGP